MNGGDGGGDDAPVAENQHDSRLVIGMVYLHGVFGRASSIRCFHNSHRRMRDMARTRA